MCVCEVSVFFAYQLERYKRDLRGLLRLGDHAAPEMRVVRKSPAKLRGFIPDLQTKSGFAARVF